MRRFCLRKMTRIDFEHSEHSGTFCLKTSLQVIFVHTPRRLNYSSSRSSTSHMWQCPHVSRACFIYEAIWPTKNDHAIFRAFRAFWYILSQNLATADFLTYPSAPKLLFEQELYESYPKYQSGRGYLSTYQQIAKIVNLYQKNRFWFQV